MGKFFQLNKTGMSG